MSEATERKGLKYNLITMRYKEVYMLNMRCT